MKISRQFTSMTHLIILFILVQCSAFGKDPYGDHLEKVKKSPNFDVTKEQFFNRRPAILEEMDAKQNWLSSAMKFMFGGATFGKPKEKLPEVKPDIEEFLKDHDSLKFIWFGHSTFMVNMEGKILLFDPVFSGSAAPFSFMIKRFQKAVLELDELPSIDYIILSHDHYDHLDKTTIEFFKTKKTKFITPLGVISHLKEWGIEEDRLFELDWWDSKSIDGLEIVCTPAQHFSGRKGFSRNKTLWSSWAVIGKQERFYFSGDSGYDTHFKTIGDKYGPFDLTFIENGQYNEMWRAVHVLPEETAQAFIDLKGKKLVPVHWGMFDLSLHDWFEPIEELEEQAKIKNIDLLTPKFGQLVKLKEDTIFERWWKKFIPTSK